jgi:hypothetical protein
MRRDLRSRSTLPAAMAVGTLFAVVACAVMLPRLARAADTPTDTTAAATPAAAGAAALSAKDTTPSKKDLIQPEELAKKMALPEAKRPLLVHVGFQVLYRSGHLPGSVYAGSGSTIKGRAELKKLLQTLPQDREIVLYCGCCPWAHCPNVNPAFRIARSRGFKNAKILYIVQDLERDWVDKGYPALVP